MKTIDILYSPGYGTGWTSCCRGTDEQRKFMLTHEPTIAALRAGIQLEDAHKEQFLADWVERFGDAKPPYMGGFFELEVMRVTGPFRIEEYDGFESVHFPHDYKWENT